MPSKSKRKGKYFEEKISEILRNSWNINQKSKIHRALTSGTYDKVEYSDIVFNLNPKPHIIVECKYRTTSNYTKDYLYLLKRLFESKEFKEWITKLELSKKKYKDEFRVYPLSFIVFGVPNKKPLAIIEYDELEKLLYLSDKLNVDFADEILHEFFYTSSYKLTDRYDVFTIDFETLLNNLLNYLLESGKISFYVIVYSNSLKRKFIVFDFEEFTKIIKPKTL
jgi:hypothetical protein